MHPTSQANRNLLALLIILMAAIAFGPSPAISAAKPLSKQEVLDLLSQDLPSEKVAEMVKKEGGINFPMTSAAEQEIRAAGGTDDLIRVLRDLAPKGHPTPAHPPAQTTTTPASPPVLVIQSTPGDSQVYVDDEPVGSTSHAGRMKLTRLPPGEHNVRVSLRGYQDHEQTITLAAGQTTTVAANLQPAAPAYNPPQAPPVEETPTAPTSPAGYLGVLPMQQQPAGARGVVISGAYPGSPAEQAGIKSYDTILALNGQAVSTPDQLRSALAGHQAGEAVAVTWYNGSTNVTRQIRLAAPPNQTQTQVSPPSYPPTLSNMPHSGFVSFAVAHDHGQGGQNYCVGVMSIGNGIIYYKATNGLHTFEIPLNSIREVKRNTVYLLAFYGFHIRTKKGTNYNFAALNQQGQPEPPDAVLTAIDQAMGK